ncbi:hypothetical protein [Actinacidiphila reveromycinica]|uniref:hypothetical protein n=1 Tax=Actinacidiphila reveromycinica TaxID=659352 RepID=UPI001F26E530|nr:hypothetical protein [Streptomyces sp. SN-593]
MVGLAVGPGAGERSAAGDRRLGTGTPLVSASGHARHDDQARFDRQLATVIAGISQRPPP